MIRSLCVAAALLACSAPVAAAEDQKVLDGEWTVVEFERGGKSPPKEFLESANVVIKDGALDLQDPRRSEPGSFTLDPKKSPGQIDLKFKEGPKNDVIREAVGIYELKDDQLKLAWRKDGTRPTEFKSIAGNRSSEHIVLKRKK